MTLKSVLTVGRREAKAKQYLETNHPRGTTSDLRTLRSHNSGKVLDRFRGK